MTLQGKVLVTIDLWAQQELIAAGEEDWRTPQFVVIAEAVVEAVASKEISIVELRVTLPTESAERMLLGMVDGETNVALRELSPCAETTDPSPFDGSSTEGFFRVTGPPTGSSEAAEEQFPAPLRSNHSNQSGKKREKLMSDKKLQLNRGAAIVLLVIAFALGGGLAALIGGWLGHPVLAASAVPVYVAEPSGGSSAAPDRAGAPDRTGFAAVVKPALPAVVNISSSRVVHSRNTPMSPFLNDPFFRQFFGNQFQAPREQREQSLGSGVIVSPEGYILTNNHVVDGATDIKVALSDKREFKGRVVGRDPKTDIAIVKINATGLPSLPLGDSSKLQVGDYVLAIGDPFGVGETVTQGIVSATGRSGLNIEGYEDFIQTDAAINPGNSGGALINTSGALVGINTAILSSAGGNQGIGFAIPINLARNVMDQIIRNGKVVRGYLGVSIQNVTPAIAKAFNLSRSNGALISDVDAKGPSAQSGLKTGDVIVGLNGQPITGPNELRLRVAELAPGSVAHLQVVSNGNSHETDVKLGELPESAGKTSGPKEGSATGPLAGVQVEALTSDAAQQLNLPADTKGVVIDSVAADSAAAEAGLRRGDVILQINRKPVTSVGEYEQTLKQTGDKQSIVLLVERGGARIFVVVEPQ
jgi:serine protease Do